MSEVFERGILFVKSKSIVIWNVTDEQKIEIYSFKTMHIEKKEHWEIWLFVWEDQREAYHFIIKSLEIRYE
jgi:hypothetical protein